MTDISLIPYDRIASLQSDLLLIKSQIANLQTDLSATTNSLQSSIESLQTSINQIDTRINGISDYIIEYSNNYRKWKSGFIEQWGYTSDRNVTLPISFSNTNYTIIFTYNCDSVTKNLNSFYIGDWNAGVEWKPNHSYWYAIGY